jgi:hypothetical protein
MISVHGGIGATWEHDAPLYFRRAQLSRAAARRHRRARHPRLAVARARPGPRGPGRAVHALGERQRRRDVPGLDDLRRRPRAARRRARARRRVGAAPDRPDYERGALAGMAMTERQGGSDVRANITRAEPLGDGLVRAPRPQVVLLLPAVRRVPRARPGARAGLSCFLVERGPGMEFQRLKDKLGTRSLPSSEVEFHGARGRSSARRGAGVPAIIRMVNHTRLDCLIGAASAMRRATSRRSTTPATARRSARRWSSSRRCATCSPTWRSSPRRRPWRRCGSRAATTAASRRSALRHGGDEVLGLQARPGHAGEALECLGGNGYVEESGMPLLYRDAPLNSIWEGSGNVAALDVLRAIVRSRTACPRSWPSASSPPGRPAARRAPRARARARGTRSPSATTAQPEERLYESQFGRGGSSRTSRSRSRPRCSCATRRRRRSPTRSAPRGSAARAATPTGRCPAGVDAGRSSTARCPV